MKKSRVDLRSKTPVRKLTREEMIALVDKIRRNDGTEAEIDAAVELFDAATARRNEFSFRLSPDVCISLTAQTKTPGEAMVGESVRLVEHHRASDEMKPYERLFGDALRGDRTLFGSEAGVEAAWRIIDPVLNSDQAPYEYEPGSRGPVEAERLAADAGGWIEPDVTCAA